MSGSSRSFTVPATPHAYPNFLNKRNDPFEHKCQIGSTTFGFVDASENLVMVDDVVMLSDSPVTPVEKEELEEASLDVNVFQRSCEKKPFRRMVRTRIDRST
jgi:hypothetical protein